MKIKIQIVIDDQEQAIVEDVAYFERGDLTADTLGLTLEEAKTITAGIQKVMVENQVTEYITKVKPCSDCGKLRSIHGYHSIIFRTLFGKLSLKSPRLFGCTCKSQKKMTFSPLTKILSERTAPELNYLQSKWASLMSYGMTANLLEEVLPIDANISSIFNKAHQVSIRLEQELGEEKTMFIEGCQRDWANLPKPDAPLAVGIDGGFIHARDEKKRKAGWFEAIVGKSLQESQPTKRFGFVTSYDTKPKRRLYEMLQNQGLQMNQAITFLSDGGENVRDLQLFLSPQAEHILDWFHVTMRLTTMKQTAKNISIGAYSKPPDEQLERAKWFLWHGNVFQALKTLESLLLDLSIFLEKKTSKEYKLYQAVDEFYNYIETNSTFIPNYGERYRYGETISSGFVESTVNELISKRMVKKQQMRWTKKGAHLLLQLRIKTLNNELKQYFHKWYPNMEQANAEYTAVALPSQ